MTKKQPPRQSPIFKKIDINQQLEAHILKKSTDNVRPTTDLSRTDPSSCSNQLFTQVFFHHQLRSEYNLIRAVVRGDIITVRFLVTIGADIHIQDKDVFWSWRRKSAWTPLMYAIHRNDLDIAHFLVESGADVNQENRKGITALIEAAGNDHIEGVKFLLQSHVNIDQQNEYGVTALMSAVMSDSMSIAKLLIESKANPDLQNKYGTTALIIASIMGQVEIVELLISSGANIHLRDQGGWTALMYAYEFYPEIVELLEKSGAKMTEEDKQKKLQSQKTGFLQSAIANLFKNFK